MRTLITALLTLHFLFYLPVSFAREPQNLSIAKQKIIRYHDSGSYEKDLQVMVTQAARYLAYRLQLEKNSKKKLAVVLDIDDTALSNYAILRQLDFGGTREDLFADVSKANDPAIKAVLKFYRYAQANKVAVFFITGRKEQFKEITIKNLQNAGYANWDGLIFKPNDYALKTVIPYKTAARQHLIAQGYTIVVNLGDQMSDLNGGAADKTFKVPNPFYLIP